MIFQFIGWLFRAFTPYLLGACIGVGFFFLLLQFASGPQGLVSAMAEKAGVTLPAEVDKTDVVTHTQEAPPPLVEDAHSADVVQEPVNTQPTVMAPEVIVVSSLATSANPPAAASESLIATQTSSPILAQREESPVSRANLDVAEDVLVEERGKVASPVAQSKAPVSVAQVDNSQPQGCGVPPRGPGVEMSRFMACQWRNNCLAYLSQSRAMNHQARNRCVMSGRNPVICRDYFNAMEQRFNVSSCNRPQAGYPVRRW
jgi:hypothetical protein